MMIHKEVTKNKSIELYATRFFRVLNAIMSVEYDFDGSSGSFRVTNRKSDSPTCSGSNRQS